MFGVFTTMELSSELYAFLDDGDRCRVMLAARLGPYDHHWLYDCADAWNAWREARTLGLLGVLIWSPCRRWYSIMPGRAGSTRRTV